jgi:dienelactone hydrolase
MANSQFTHTHIHTHTHSHTHRGPWLPEETGDSLEVLDWVAKQRWSNGRVGLWGISYEGTAALLTAGVCVCVRMCVCVCVCVCVLGAVSGPFVTVGRHA